MLSQLSPPAGYEGECKFKDLLFGFNFYPEAKSIFVTVYGSLFFLSQLFNQLALDLCIVVQQLGNPQLADWRTLFKMASFS